MEVLMKKIFLLSTCLLFTACSSMGDMGDKFTSTHVEDISVFSDNTVALIRDLDLATERADAIYIREYLKMDEPEEMQLASAVKKTNILMQQITDYSIEIVTLSETPVSEDEKIIRYHDYMKPIAVAMAQNLELDAGHYDKTMEDIRESGSFRDALKAAQPIINGVSRTANNYSNLTIESIETVIAKIDQSIEREYAEVISYQEGLEFEKYEVLKGIGYVYESFRGDDKAYKKLRSSNVILDKSLTPASRPSNEGLIKIRDHLLVRLDILHTVGNEIAPDWEIYRASLNELNETSTEAVTSTNRIRIVAMMWVRAHGKMASGKTKPAEWFDISDAPSALIKLAL